MYYFIRHAQSNFNIIRNKIRQKYQNYHIQKQWLQQRFNLNNLDSQLSQKGIKQAQQCRQLMKNQDIEYVVVSPLRRTLQTCHIIFSQHKDHPKIIVDPFLRQYFQSTCDIGSRLQQSMTQFPHFNFSLFQQDIQAWYIHYIFDQQIKQSILQKLSLYQGKQRHQKAIQYSLQFLKDLHKKIQNDEEILSLMKGPMRKQLKYIKEKYNFKNKQNGKNIAIVSHSENIKMYFGVAVNNCEVYKVKQEDMEKK